MEFFDTSYNVNRKDSSMKVKAPCNLGSLYREDSQELETFSVDLYDDTVISDIRKGGYYFCEYWSCGYPYVGTYNVELYGSHRRERTDDTKSQRYKIRFYEPRDSISFKIPEKVEPLRKKK